jgi:hypothetical protein
MLFDAPGLASPQQKGPPGRESVWAADPKHSPHSPAVDDILPGSAMSQT